MSYLHARRCGVCCGANRSGAGSDAKLGTLFFLPESVAFEWTTETRLLYEVVNLYSG